jgi:hypothetical protein
MSRGGVIMTPLYETSMPEKKENCPSTRNWPSKGLTSEQIPIILVASIEKWRGDAFVKSVATCQDLEPDG